MDFNVENFMKMCAQLCEKSHKIGFQEAKLDHAHESINDLREENERLKVQLAEKDKLIAELTETPRIQSFNVNILNVFSAEGIIPLSADKLDLNLHKLSKNEQIFGHWIITESLWDAMPPELNGMVRKAVRVENKDMTQPHVQNNYLGGSNAVVNNNGITMTGNEAVYNENNNKPQSLKEDRENLNKFPKE